VGPHFLSSFYAPEPSSKKGSCINKGLMQKKPGKTGLIFWQMIHAEGNEADVAERMNEYY
jgi:hypothetical protein